MIVVSDSHLSARTPEATAHWDALVDHVTADPPDLVVHAGDITTDGEVVPDDLDYARRQLDRVPASLVVGARQPRRRRRGGRGRTTATTAIGADTLGRYRAAFGPTGSPCAAGRWRCSGVDAQLLGSGEPEEDDQWAWLDDEIRRVPAGDARSALVLHKPLVPGRPGSRSARRATCPSRPVGGSSPSWPASTAAWSCRRHVHQALRRDRDGLAHVWVPSSWAALPDRIQASIGAKRVG